MFLLCFQASGVHFSLTKTTNLGNLLALHLHTCLETCIDIVDRAEKELLVEQVRCIHELAILWRSFKVITFRL